VPITAVALTASANTTASRSLLVLIVISALSKSVLMQMNYYWWRDGLDAKSSEANRQIR